MLNMNRSIRADRGNVRPRETGRAVTETRERISPTRRDALVARAVTALRTASNPEGRRTGPKTG